MPNPDSCISIWHMLLYLSMTASSYLPTHTDWFYLGTHCLCYCHNCHNYFISLIWLSALELCGLPVKCILPWVFCMWAGSVLHNNMTLGLPAHLSSSKEWASSSMFSQQQTCNGALLTHMQSHTGIVQISAFWLHLSSELSISHKSSQ